jgi:hypothetical protein
MSMSQIVIPDNPFEIRTIPPGRKALFYQGQEAFLAGIYAPTDKLDGNFDAMMRVLSERRNNFFRHWTTNYYLFNSAVTPSTPTGEPPRKRYSPFLWNVSKWELSGYNVDYFTRLRSMISAAARAGIVVQITIFDRTGMAAATDRWPFNPWKASNNANGLILDIPAIPGQPPPKQTGVPRFYDRTIQGHVRTREPIDRELTSGGIRLEPISLGELQDSFVNQVVIQTREFRNVVYEIMNEPMEGTPATRAEWANTIVGLIHSLTQGKRLIFYNDHSGSMLNPATRGQDVNYWKTIPAARSHYSRFHGVIFHGDPNTIDPANANTSGWTFEADKIIQVSSDAYDEAKRDDRVWTRATTLKAFERHLIYQAESVDTDAADGIRDTQKTTLLRFV